MIDNGTPPNVLYFGCLRAGNRGHAWYAPGLRPLPSRSWLSPTLRAYIDAVFPPDDTEQVEGRYTVSHAHGFTVVAWWDRSGDSRRASNSAFVSPGRWGGESVVRAGLEAFPSIAQRMGYPLEPAGEWAAQPPSLEHIEKMRQQTKRP